MQQGGARQRKKIQSTLSSNSGQFNNAYLTAKYKDALQRRLKRKTPLSVRIVRYFAILVAVFGLLGRYHSFMRKTEEDLLAAPGKLIQIDDDTFFHLQCHNPTDGSDYSKTPTVILVHGILGNSLEWQPIIKEISRHARVCTIDRAFFSLFRFNQSRNCTALSNEMDAILQTASIDPPYVLVGHSLGGLVVHHYTYTHPKKVSGLVLIDPTHEDLRTIKYTFFGPLDIMRVFIRLCKYLSGFGFVRFLGYFRLMPLPTALYSSEHLVNMLYSDPTMWVRAADELAHIDASMDIMKDMRSTHELRPDFPLVVITALDRPAQEFEVSKSMHASLARLSTNGHHVIAPHSAHWVHLQQPEIVNNAILEVLEKNGYSIE